MNNQYNTIHETVIKDVIDTVKDGINASRSATSKGYNGSISTASSLSKATSGLTLIFPVLVDGTIPIETAGMLTKAIETRAVSMLQIAFSAFNVTNSKDAYDFIKNFHTNLGSNGKMTIEDVLTAMESIGESNNISYETRTKIAAVLEDFKYNCNYYLGDDVSESSINDYKIIPGYASDFTIVKEEITEKDIDNLTAANKKMFRRANQNNFFYTPGGDNSDNIQHAERLANADLQGMRLKMQVDDATRKDANNSIINSLNKDKFEHQKDEDEKNRNHQIDRDRKRDSQWAADYAQREKRNKTQNAKDNIEMLSKMVLPGDIKKANEMMPTMMAVNFCTTDENLGVAIQRQIIIGVKAKLIPVNPSDVSNKIIVKHADANVLLKFIRSTTRETSFFKDFLFAIDNAKINAVASSKKGSLTYRYMRVLERRALKGKIRKTLRMDNTAKAMTTLAVSSELVNQIKIENHIDLERADVIRPIMEKLNLMIFIIVDETGENIKLIMDTGDDSYETISYTHLERDTSSRDLKKSINLMTKMNR